MPSLCVIFAALSLTLGLCQGVAVDWEFLTTGARAPITISVRGEVTFTWDALHGVYQLADGAGVACPDPLVFPDASAELAPASFSGTYSFVGSAPGIYNIACPVGSHCTAGNMLQQIIVGSGVSAPTGASTAPTPAPAMAPDTAPVASP